MVPTAPKEAASAASAATLRTTGEDGGAKGGVEGSIVVSRGSKSGSAIVVAMPAQVLGAA